MDADGPCKWRVSKSFGGFDELCVVVGDVQDPRGLLLQ
jgi:hypothetical protein